MLSIWDCVRTEALNYFKMSKMTEWRSKADLFKNDGKRYDHNCQEGNLTS